MDRTVATGTGYIGQYSPAVRRMYESLETCPDDLLLFMHHVPYTHVLHSGKTVIQYIYDLALRRRRRGRRVRRDWRALEGRVDAGALSATCCEQLEYQAGQAIVWRDAVTSWFLRASGIADAKGRVGTLSGPRRGGVDDADRLAPVGRDAVGNRVRRSGRRVPAAAVHARHSLHRRGRDARHRRPVLRREHRGVAFPAARRRQGGGGVDRWRTACRRGSWMAVPRRGMSSPVCALDAGRSNRDRRVAGWGGNGGARLRGEVRAPSRRAVATTRHGRARRRLPESRCACTTVHAAGVGGVRQFLGCHLLPRRRDEQVVHRRAAERDAGRGSWPAAPSNVDVARPACTRLTRAAPHSAFHRQSSLSMIDPSGVPCCGRERHELANVRHRGRTPRRSHSA